MAGELICRLNLETTDFATDFAPAQIAGKGFLTLQGTSSTAVILADPKHRWLP